MKLEHDKFVLLMIMVIMFGLGWIFNGKYIKYKMKQDAKTEMYRANDEMDKMIVELEKYQDISIIEPDSMFMYQTRTIRAHERFTVWYGIYSRIR